MINQINLFGPVVSMERRTVQISQIDGLNQLLGGHGLASINVLGMLQEPILRELENGRFRIADGKGRIRAALDAGRAEIDAKVIPSSVEVSPAALAAITVISNIGRRRNPVAEALSIHESIIQFAADAGLDPAAPDTVRVGLQSFASAMGVNVSQVESLYKVARLPAELLEASLNGEIAPTVIERLAGKSPEFVELALETFREMGALTGKILRELSITAAQRALGDLEAREPGMFADDDSGAGARADAEADFIRAARRFFAIGGHVREGRELLKRARANDETGGEAL